MVIKNQRSKSEDQEKVQALENQIKRALADYQNLEKRTAEERARWIKNSNRELISKLLPVLDDLYLANKHLNDEGLRLSIQKLHGVLVQEGLEDFYTKGMKFDPAIMEAVDVREGEEGIVLEEVRSGYKLHGDILRPAQVIVGKENIDKKAEEQVKKEEQRGADEA